MRAWVWPIAASQLSSCLAFHQGAMPGEPKDATYIEANDTRVRYVDTGQGPAVVLLHGYASSLDVWAPVIPALAARHRVIALDLRGFGWTDRPPADYSPSGQAALVREIMDRLGVRRAALVAHSWGSSVALTHALESPERVAKIALYDAWVYESQLPSFFVWSRLAGVGETLFSLYYRERPAERLATAFYDGRYVTPELREAVELAMQRPGTVAAALATARGQRYTALERRYREVQQPVLLLWGREDRVSPLAAGERLVRDLPHAALEVYERCGHFPMIEAREASTGALARFLDEDERTARR
jgi:pimeloyl-ACP methyl ester carboxylesterase